MTERPVYIWLIHGIGEGGADVWADEPNPDGVEPPPESTAYVRLDKAEEHVFSEILNEAARKAVVEILQEKD